MLILKKLIIVLKFFEFWVITRVFSIAFGGACLKDVIIGYIRKTLQV